MKRETRVAYGTVPTHLFGNPLAQTTWQMQDGAFLLRAEGDHYFYYSRGEGITVHRGAGADASEESLWLNGSVYAAIASMNGLLPVHASAIAFDGKVFAFTGTAGAGKSTLAAALGQHGMALFCDDTLILDLSDPDRMICLPGHKRLKLLPDALELTGAAREEQVSQTYGKYYASPAAGTIATALPLAELIFLEVGPTPSIKRISGSERFARMQDDHQMSRLFEAASQFDRAAQFAHRSRLARQIEMARFERPRDAAHFDAGLLLVADHVKGHGG